MAVRVSAGDFEEKVLRADKPVLLDFYSDTCIPCKKMAGALGNIEEDYEGRLYVYKVNVNYDMELAQQFHVMSAPTLVLLANGEEKDRLRGAAGEEQIADMLDKNI
jgi:thioredoxin 1